MSGISGINASTLGQGFVAPDYNKGAFWGANQNQSSHYIRPHAERDYRGASFMMPNFAGTYDDLTPEYYTWVNSFYKKWANQQASGGTAPGSAQIASPVQTIATPTVKPAVPPAQAPK